MGFVGNYAPCGLSPQTDGMPVIQRKLQSNYQLCSFPFEDFFSVRRTRGRHRRWRSWGFGVIPQQAFWPVQSGQNRKTCICLHCLLSLSRIRDKDSYTESWIIPKPYFSACFHADFVQKIRDNFFSLLSWFQYFFIRSFPTFGIIL